MLGFASFLMLLSESSPCVGELFCLQCHYLPYLPQGVLPPVLLAVLMMLLPIVLRLFARFEGIPKYTGLELSLMTRFFIFQVIVCSFTLLLPKWSFNAT